MKFITILITIVILSFLISLPIWHYTIVEDSETKDEDNKQKLCKLVKIILIFIVTSEVLQLLFGATYGVMFYCDSSMLHAIKDSTLCILVIILPSLSLLAYIGMIGKELKTIKKMSLKLFASWFLIPIMGFISWVVGMFFVMVGSGYHG